MSKIQPVVTRSNKKHHPEGMNIRRTLHTKRKRKWYKKITWKNILGKSDISKQTNKKRKKIKERNTCGYRNACLISKDDLTKDRGFNESIETKNEAKQNKRNTREKTPWHLFANQTPGGYKFASLVASQQGRANQHELPCFGLSSSWFFPSRSGIPLHAVVQYWFSLQRSISP